MVKPIAIVDNLAKTPLAERVNQLQKAAPDTDQRQAQQVVQEQHAQRRQQAVQPEATDQAIIHRDPKKQPQQEQKRDKDKDKDKQEQPSGLDVTA